MAMPNEATEPPVKLPGSGWFMAMIGLALVVLGLAHSLTLSNNTASEAPGLTSTANPSAIDENSTLPLSKATTSKIKINNLTLDVFLAADPVAQAQGLSGRPALGPLEGMLFIFNRDTEPNFWMKDMNFAIDIIWIDQAGRVIAIEPNLTPDTYPNYFAPPEPIRYVLEVNAGFADTHQITLGNFIHFLEPEVVNTQ